MRLKVSNVCQLLDKSKFAATGTLNGVTFHNNGDGSYTLNGTSTDYIYFNFYKLDKKLRASVVQGVISSAGYYGEDCWYDVNNDLVFYLIEPGETVNNQIIRPQIFDLTEMYGTGHEPTTVEQFRQDFPNEMYDYSPVCWEKFRIFKYVANKQPVQLLDKSKFPATQTNNGVTFTNNGDGTITANGTSTKNFAEYGILHIPKPPIGHKILVLPSTNLTIQNHIYVYASNTNGIWIDDLGHGGRIITITEITSSLKKTYTTISININANEGWTMNNHIYKPQLFDLTAMYGAGNEPTTVEQFRADFPNELYDYNPYNYLTLNRGKYIANKEPVQLVDKSNYPATGIRDGVTWTNNGDGTITANGTTNEVYANYIIPMPQFKEVKNDHKYVLFSGINDINVSFVECICYLGGQDGSYFATNCAETKFADTVGFVIPQGEYPLWQRVELRVRRGYTANDLTFKPQLFDLTEMYGAGNEPTTVEQFRADFPNELYDYNPYNAITFR